MQRLLETRKCTFCGKQVDIYHKKRLEAKNTFCSKECFGAYTKSQHLNCICPICGTKFKRSESHLKRYNSHECCCSKKCLAIYRSDKYKGENNPNYNNRGDKSPLFKEDFIHCGYRWGYVPEHPFAVAGGRVREHRLVAEKYLLNETNSIEINGERYLKPEYDVHHKNFDKLDNRVVNLEVLTRSDHKKLHHKLKNSNVIK